MAKVLRAIGLSTSPGNYRTTTAYIQKLGLNTDHFLGKGHSTSVTPQAQPLDFYLNNQGWIQSTKLKVKLLRAGLLEERCTLCGVGPEWNGQRLVLQLDHIDGNASDNSLSNLRILCPNCHSQTKTFTGKQGQRYRRPAKYCDGCKVEVSPRAERCRSCEKRTQTPKIEWPETSALVREVEQTSYLAVARRLGVSDNAIRKHLRRRV